MQRSLENLQEYRQACKKVITRADNRCEVLVDKNGNACIDEPKHRCCKFIADDQITYTNFLHKETRNGKSDKWVCDPDNIIFGCASHHWEESRTGQHVEQVQYDKEELQYIPDEE